MKKVVYELRTFHAIFFNLRKKATYLTPPPPGSMMSREQPEKNPNHFTITEPGGRGGKYVAFLRGWLEAPAEKYVAHPLFA